MAQWLASAINVLVGQSSAIIAKSLTGDHLGF